MVSKKLEENGYEVFSSESIKEGIKSYIALRLLVVFINYDLPDGAGIALFEKLKQINRHIIGIMVIPSGKEEVVREALLAGVQEYVIKDSFFYFLKLLPFVVKKAREKQRLIFENIEKRESLERVNSELNDLNEFKNNFMEFLSNEFKDSVNSILGFCDQLTSGGKGPLREKQVNILKNVAKSGGMLRDFGKNILELNSKNHRRDKPIFNKMDLMDSVNFCISLMSLPADRNKVKLQLLSPVSKFLLRADKKMVSQILLNLLSNAIKFSEKGEVTLKVEPKDDNILLAIRDNGVGMAPETLETIYQPFKKVNIDTVRDFGGAGLGLSIVKNYIEIHGGKISVASELGKGTEFVVQLPNA